MPSLLKRAKNFFGKKKGSEPSSAPEDRAPASNAAQQEALQASGRADLLRARRGASETPALDLPEEASEQESEEAVAPGETFRVSCRGFGGGLWVDGLRATTTAGALRQAAAEKAGTPDDGSWYLMHRGRPLRDTHMLEDLGIRDGDEVVRQFRLQGGWGEQGRSTDTAS